MFGKSIKFWYGYNDYGKAKDITTNNAFKKVLKFVEVWETDNVNLTTILEKDIGLKHVLIIWTLISCD